METISIILTLILFYGSVRLLRAFLKYKSHKLILFSLTLFFYGLGSLLWIDTYIEFNMNQFITLKSILDWLQVTGVSFGLSALAIENWEDRPPVVRFPYILSFTPLLLIVTFVFVFQTFYLRELILSIYEAGALTISLILFLLFTVKNADYLYVTIGMVLFLLCFTVYWFPSEVIEANMWVWKIIAISGLLLAIHGYMFATIKVIELQKAENG